MSRSFVLHGEDVLTVPNPRRPGTPHVVRPQLSDIDRCVPFSPLRCVLSMISIALVLTDIPRTGIFIDLFRYYPKVGPDSVMYYGPYAYPVAHMNRTNGTDAISPILAFAGDTRLEEIDLWAYKYDSLSIPTRALAEHLNVSSYPPCLLYREPCRQSTLTVKTTFTMVDDLLTAITGQYFTHELLRHLPIVFQTTSYWVDRLHHIVLGRLGYRVEARLHSVYQFHAKLLLDTGAAVGIDVCKQISASESNHPLVCKAPVAWRCDHPFLGEEIEVSLVDNVKLRVAALQERYPTADIELTMITTRSVLRSHPTSFFLPAVFYRSDSTEITTLIRGRECRSNSHCVTVFLDDYRYERAILQTSIESLKMFTSILRAISQLYIWLRVVLLVFICCRSRLAETRHRGKSVSEKLFVVFLTFGKIPSQVVVYGSWLPIVGYSAAYWAESGLVHIIGENFWSTTKGLLSFNVMTYLVVANIQMRNIWLIALVWKCAMTVYNRFCLRRNEYWRPENGLVAFRGFFIGATSSLTIFAFFRAIRFRDSRVIAFDELQRYSGSRDTFHIQRLHKGAPDFGYTLDAKATTVAVAVIIGLVHLMRMVTRMSQKAVTGSFFCHTFYVPLSTGVLFRASALNPFWYTELARGQEYQATTRGISRRSPSADLLKACGRVLSAVRPLGTKPGREGCATCDFVSASVHWRAVQGCRRHETLFTIGRRSVETQSMVRLMHIGVFSDPIVFFQLRVLGRKLYLYHVRDCSPRSTRATRTLSAATRREGQEATNPESLDANPITAFLSPIPLPRKGDERSHSLGDTDFEYVFVACVNSTSVPWSVLVDCG